MIVEEGALSSMDRQGLFFLAQSLGVITTDLAEAGEEDLRQLILRQTIS